MTSFLTNQQPEFDKLISELRLENSRFDRELRSTHRDVMITPVRVIFNENSGIDQSCVSRNISSAGVSLISALQMPEGVSAILEIYRLTQTPDKQIVAECRWSRPFGHQFWMSGWQFMHIRSRT